MTGAQRSLGVGAVGLAVCMIGAVLNGPAQLQGWMVATLFWLAAPVGALGLMLLHRLTGGEWGTAAGPALRAAAATLPLIGIAFIPLAVWIEWLFLWAAPGAPLTRVLFEKSGYLNGTAFLLRTLGYFLFWLLLAAVTGAWGRGRPPFPGIAAVGLILWLISVALFGVDWVMSLSPRWSAEAFPIAIAAGMVTTTLSLLLLDTDLPDAPRDELVRVLFALALFWVYLLYLQYLVVWTGNLPHQISWYLQRRTPAWQAIATTAFVVTAAVGLGGLFWRAGRQHRGILQALLWGLLVAQMLAMAWMVLPGFSGAVTMLSWTTAASLAGLGGVWGAAFLGLKARSG